MSYTTLVVNLLLLITQTASAPLDFQSPYANKLMSGLPCVLVFQITAWGSVFFTFSTISLPNVSSGFGAVQRIRQGTFCAMITARQGPIPEPVATRTMERKSVAMRRTPQVGMPRT
jgi:nucleoside recognition membrane protein YjiH